MLEVFGVNDGGSGPTGRLPDQCIPGGKAVAAGSFNGRNSYLCAKRKDRPTSRNISYNLRSVNFSNSERPVRSRYDPVKLVQDLNARNQTVRSLEIGDQPFRD